MSKKVICKECQAFEVKMREYGDSQPYKGKCRLKAPTLDAEGNNIFPAVYEEFWCFEGVPKNDPRSDDAVAIRAVQVAYGDDDPDDDSDDDSDEPVQIASGWYAHTDEMSILHLFPNTRAVDHESACGKVTASFLYLDGTGKDATQCGECLKERKQLRLSNDT